MLGYAVPFHISTIKSVSLTNSGDNDHVQLRINFVTPGVAVGKREIVVRSGKYSIVIILYIWCMYCMYGHDVVYEYTFACMLYVLYFLMHVMYEYICACM